MNQFLNRALRCVTLVVVAASNIGLCDASAGGQITLPFAETFAGAGMPAGWNVDVTTGSEIRPGKEGLEIHSPANTYAHVEHALGEDFIRVTADIKPSPATTWCTSIFLYWNTGNWCQLGLIDRGGGALLAAEMVDGVYRERDISKRAFDAWHPLGVELAADCIRYGTMEGGAWKTVEVRKRPEQFTPAPALLILGKGYGGPAGYPAEDLDNNYASPGGPGTSMIRNLRVEALPHEKLRETAEERAVRMSVLRDKAGEAELAGEQDPTFESVSRHFPPLKFSREVVGVKDHHDAIGVAADGALQPNHGITETTSPIVYWEIGEPGYRFGSGGVLPQKRLHEGWMPIVVATDARDTVTLEQTIFGQSDGMTVEKPLFGVVRLTVSTSNTTAQSLPVRLVLRKGPETKTLLEKSVSVSPTEMASLFVKVPFDVEKEPVAEISTEVFAGALAQTVLYWKKLIDPLTRFSIPEERVQNAYRAWLAYNFLNVKTRDGVTHICDGSGFYNIIYGYSAALYCHILDLVGAHEQARVYLDDLLTFQRPDGLWYVNYGHTDTGTMLKVLADHYRLTGDAEWLRRVAPKMIAMCEWIEKNRKESMLHTHARRAVVHGLIRFQPYCDYALPAFDYYSNGYLAVGMQSAADVFREIGMTAEAERFDREAKTYRNDILVSMDSAVVTRDGTRMLPIMPENQFLLKESHWTANGYYGLIASCLLESGVLDANDPRTNLVMSMMREHGGLTAGVCRFFNRIDHAYTYGYWNVCMDRDEIDRVILGLYGSMAYGMSRDTFAAVEVTSVLTGENDHTLPHTYSNTKQVRLVRNMLLREVGKELHVAPFAPREWLASGKKLAVNEAPTKFGPVTYSIETNDDASEIVVKLTPPTRHAPEAIRVRLRHPGSAAIKSVDVRSAMHEVQGDVIRLTDVTAPVELRVRY